LRIPKVLYPESVMKRALPVFLIALLAVMATAFTARAQLINVTYAGVQSGRLTGKELAADSVIKVVQPGIEVISFQMQHYLSPWSPVIYKSNSNKITPEMRKQFKRVHRDDLLFLTNIKAVNATGDTLWASPIQFKIK
jgi:hypothetical protein